MSVLGRLSLAHSYGAMFFACTAILLFTAHAAHAAFLLEIDIDGVDDGTVTFNPLFRFGGDTTAATQSEPSFASGTNRADSIFGGNGIALPDTYLYTYTPSQDQDNLFPEYATDLGHGSLASGQLGGRAGVYRIYATWPFSKNVLGGLTQYTISYANGKDQVIQIDQSNAGSGAGDEWFLLAQIKIKDPSKPITIKQEAVGEDRFVSMRAYGLLFEYGEEALSKRY